VISQRQDASLHSNGSGTGQFDRSAGVIAEQCTFRLAGFILAEAEAPGESGDALVNHIPFTSAAEWLKTAAEAWMAGKFALENESNGHTESEIAIM